MNHAVIFTLSLACTSAFALPKSTAPAEDCVRCGSIQHLLNDMAATPPNPANKRTEEKQEQLFNRASELIPQILKKRPMTEATARALITLIAKANQYENDGTLGADNSGAFRWHWALADKIFPTVTDQLVLDNKISPFEKQQMLEEMGVIDSPGAPTSPRKPQSVSPKKK